MRKLKFRAWDKLQNKYVFTGFHVIGEVTVFDGIGLVIQDTMEERREKFGHQGSIEAWDDFIIEQFTGLKDSNDVDMYEGDRFKSSTTGEYIHSISWSNNSAGFHLAWVHATIKSKEHKIEIVGNVHENTELIGDLT